MAILVRIFEIEISVPNKSAFKTLPTHKISDHKTSYFLLNSNNDKTKIPEFREIDNNGYSEQTLYYCVDSTYPKREGPMGNYMYCGINCVDSEYPNRAHGDNYRYSEPTQFGELATVRNPHVLYVICDAHAVERVFRTGVVRFGIHATT